MKLIILVFQRYAGKYIFFQNFLLNSLEKTVITLVSEALSRYDEKRIKKKRGVLFLDNPCQFFIFSNEVMDIIYFFQSFSYRIAGHVQDLCC